MWGTFLSEPLLIVDLVSRYPTNYLIRSVLTLYPYVSSVCHAALAHMEN